MSVDIYLFHTNLLWNCEERGSYHINWHLQKYKILSSCDFSVKERLSVSWDNTQY